MTRPAAAAMLALTLALALAIGPARALELTDMSDAERQAFRAEVRAYLLDNPEVLLEAINLLEQKQAAAAAHADRQLIAANAEAIFNDGYSWVGGNPEGDVTLVEFMDYRCGFCRRAAPEVASLLQTDGNIRFIVKEFPILGEDSLQSSRFAIATKLVAGDEAYAQVHEALMSFNGEVSEIALRRLGEGLGLDTEAILARMDSDEVRQVIAKNHALAQKLGITGTPTFVLGDQLLRGYLPEESMRKLVEEQRAGG